MGSIIKNLAVAVILVGVIYLGYNMFFAGNSSELMLGEGSSEGQLIASEFLIKLNELQTINFSSAIFSDPRFDSLTSFSTLPEPVESGRTNPFSF